jgi:hypothetical protein
MAAAAAIKGHFVDIRSWDYEPNEDETLKPNMKG